MRSHETAGKSAIFVEDILDGGCRMVCECQQEYQPTFEDEINDKPYYCTECGEEVCYRPWYVW